MQEILDEIEDNGIIVLDMEFKDNLLGLYIDGVIFIDPRLSNAQKRCVLAEELSHHYVNYGNILNINNLYSIKQEKIARGLTFRKLISLDDIIESRTIGIDNVYDLADYYNVTVDFVMETREYYKNKYGIIEHNGHIINFHTNEVEKIEPMEAVI